MKSPTRACSASNNALSHGASRSDTYPARLTMRPMPPQDTLPHPAQRALSLLDHPAFPTSQSALINTIRNNTHELGTIPWSLLATETAGGASLGPLLTSVQQGKPITSDDPTLTRLRPIFESLYSAGGVLFYQDRVVVPPSLRHRVLHAAHQGTSSMEQGARAIVYWPGMSQDIRNTREGCPDCSRNAPSQAATPLCHQLLHYPHSNPSLQTSSTSAAATTWS